MIIAADELRARRTTTPAARAMERVNANKLAMKMSDAEWQWDRKKLTLYFTAEKRVDFRALVRELASMFRTRIELKQIGVRDEAQAARRRRPLRPPVLLGVVAAGAAAGEPRRRQGSAAVAQPVADLRRVRAPDVLPALRARVLRAEPQAIPEGRQDRRRRVGEEKVVANDIFRERVTLRSDDGEHAHDSARSSCAKRPSTGGAPLPFAPAPSDRDARRARGGHRARGGSRRGARRPLEPLEEGGQVDGWTGEPEEAEDTAEPQEPSSRRSRPAVQRPIRATGHRPPDDHIKRPRRRRGRRGGRRNRPGGGDAGGPSGGPPDGTPPGGA